MSIANISIKETLTIIHEKSFKELHSLVSTIKSVSVQNTLIASFFSAFE